MNNKVNLSETIDYINKNIVPAESGRKCVDGRYLPTQASGMLARPGGDCGYVMALLAVSKRKALGMTPEHCFNVIYKVIKDQNGNFCMHTDNKVDPNSHTRNGIIGCGHLAKAATKNFSSKYDLVSQDVLRLVDYARNVAEISTNLEMVNLTGDHAEAGVLIINSNRYSVNSEDPKLKKMYFIYDEERDNDFLKMLVNQMAIPGVTFTDMKKESDLQLQATLNNLAAGLPVYSVEFQGKKPVVYFLSFTTDYEKKDTSTYPPFIYPKTCSLALNKELPLAKIKNPLTQVAHFYPLSF